MQGTQPIQMTSVSSAKKSVQVFSHNYARNLLTAIKSVWLRTFHQILVEVHIYLNLYVYF